MEDSNLTQKLSTNDPKEYEKCLLLAYSKGVQYFSKLVDKNGFDQSRMKNGAIRYASEHGHYKIVKFLLQDKRIDPSDDTNYSVRWSSRNGHDRIVELLLQDKRVDPSVKHNEAIRMSSCNGHEKVVSLLLQDGRVNPGDKNNFAIRWAFKNRKYNVVILLLRSKKVSTSFNDNCLLKWATKTGRCEAFFLLLQDKKVRDCDFAFEWSSENGCYKIIEYLLQDNCLSVDLNKAMGIASSNGHEKIVSLLLKDKRVDPSADNNYAIRMASMNGHEKIVSLLLKDKRVDPSTNNNYAIRMASKNGHEKIVSLLLKDKRVDPSDSVNIFNFKSSKRSENNFCQPLRNGIESSLLKGFRRWGRNAMIKASENGHEKVVKLLLKRVDPSADCNYAILLASENGHTKVVSLLLNDKRVDPSVDNYRVIRIASQNGHYEIVSLICDHILKRWNSFPNLGNNHEKIILFLLKHTKVDPSLHNNYFMRWSSFNGKTEIILLLLQDRRVDPSFNSNYLIKWASENGHKEIVSALLQDTRVDPSVNSNYLIKWASENGHKYIVATLLLDSRVDPSVDCNYAIRLASKNCHANVVLLLLEDKRVDPSVNNNYLIKWASENGHENIVSMLLQDSRVDPNVDHDYSIRKAIQNGFKIVFLLLLEKCLRKVEKFPTMEKNEFLKIYKNFEESSREKCKISELVKGLKGKIYTGSLKDCKFHGFGKLYKLSSRLGGIIKPKEKLIYEGYWKEGKKHGGGKLYNENGIMLYYGNFVENKKEGFGIIYDKEGVIRERGLFRNDKLEKSIPLDAKVEIKIIKDENLIYRIHKIVFNYRRVREKYLLGTGKESEVYCVNSKYAFKYFKNFVPENKSQVNKIMRETFIIDQLKHPHVLKVYGLNDKSPLGILMELCSMSVWKLIKLAEKKRNESKNKKFEENISFHDKIKLIFQTCLGMEFLHANQWDNCLISKFPSVSVKIADFGLSRYNEAKTMTSGAAGTPAPEIFTIEKLKFPFDVYAFGVMLYELLFETTDPFQKQEKIDKFNGDTSFYGYNLCATIHSRNLRPVIPKNECSERNAPLVQLMQQCWSEESSKRPTFSEIVSFIQTNFGESEIKDKKLLDGKIVESREFDVFDFEKNVPLREHQEKIGELKKEIQRKDGKIGNLEIMNKNLKSENQQKEDIIGKLRSEMEKKEEEISKLKKLLEIK